MIKKIVAIAMATAVLTFAATAMAETGTGTVANRSTNTVFATSPTATDSMPEFREDDSVSFIVTGVKANDQITFLTHKYGEEPNDSTVQYIDQYKATSSTQKIDYVIRDIGVGVYELKIKANDNELYTAYYKVVDEEIPEDIKVTGITLDKEAANLEVGGTIKLTATVAPSNISP